MPSPRDTGIDRELVEAMGALGNERRVEILFALADAEREHRVQWYPMSFTELYEVVAVDSTSQFSYHLRRLVGPFVAETPEGYRLTHGGAKIVRAIRSELYEGSRTSDEVAVDGACLYCGAAALVASLDDERFVVRCDDCDTPVVTDFFPRSQANRRTPAEIVDSFGARIWSTCVLARRGVCPECFGRVETELERHDFDGETRYTFGSACPECWLAVHLPIEVFAALHPAAIGFFHDHGVSILDLPLWELFAFLADGTVRTEVAAEDPLEATVSVSFGGETLRLRLDGPSTVRSLGVDGRGRTETT